MPQAGPRQAGAQSTPPAEQTQTAPTPPEDPATSDAPAADATRVTELEAENARLREQLAAAGQTATPAKPTEPSFGISEGQRAELEATGKTVSPFTGARQVGTGKPGEKPREVTADEFAKTAAKTPAASAAKTAAKK